MTRFSAPATYRATSLETAACLWEAVLEMEDGPEHGPAIRAAREALGTSHLRLTVLGWTDLVDEAWRATDGDDDMGTGGRYSGPFDWEFVPGWIAANVDWSNPHQPTCHSST